MTHTPKQPDTPAEKDTKSEVSKHSSEDVNKPTESWEERFKKEYSELYDQSGFSLGRHPQQVAGLVLHFIRTEIAQARKEQHEADVDAVSSALSGIMDPMTIEEMEDVALSVLEKTKPKDV